MAAVSTKTLGGVEVEVEISISTFAFRCPRCNSVVLFRYKSNTGAGFETEVRAAYTEHIKTCGAP